MSVSVPASVLSISGAAAVPYVYQFTAAAPGGTGSFTAPAATPELPMGTNPRNVVLGDVDGDLDLLTTNLAPASLGGGTVNVRLNDGAGTFTAPAANAEVSVGLSPRGITLGDVDGDGDLDLLTANYNINAVSVRLNQTAVPIITSFAPASGPVGGIVTITGTGLGGATSVSFNGVVQTVIISNTPTSLTVAVPVGATTGSVSVTALGGTFTTPMSQYFTVITNLNISTGTVANPVSIVAGAYQDITITGSGVGQLSGPTSASGTVTVAGTLLTNCLPLTGTANFLLVSGSTLSICDAAGLSNVPGTGTIQTTGTRSYSIYASYLYDGSQAQVTGDAVPSQVLNLSTTNPSNVTLSQPVAVLKIVTVGGSGNLVLNGQALTLLSSNAGTALVVNSGTGVVQGATGTMQRYIDASGNPGLSGYRHYSPPVSGATVGGFSTSAYGGSFTAQVNPAYNTANPNLLTLATYPNVFSYDESKIATSPATSFSDFDKGYQSPASTGTALAVGRGYAVQIGNGEKVQFTGTFNTGNQTIGGLTYAAAGTAGVASAGWALVGNPYPAPLAWGTVAAGQLSGVDAAAYVFQSTSAYAGRYTPFTNGVGAGTGLIASSQAFFVHTTTPGTTGSIALTNANRVTDYASQPNFQRQGETRPLLRLSLGLGSQPATIATAQDETFVYFEQGATDGFDGKYDAYKLQNPSGYYLGSVTPGPSPVGLSIDARSPLLAATLTEIPLWISLPAGTYTLTATELLNFATLAGGTQVQLRDALLGTLTDLATTPSHAFQVAASAPYAGRFSLVFRTSAALAALPGTELAQAQASLYPNPATSATVLSVTGLPDTVASLQVEVLDVLGRAVGRYALPAQAGSARQRVATDGLASSLYLLRLTARDAQGQVLGTLPTQRLTLTR
ncbi:MAG: beta strand repeat-containing protein [Janthinobacterium lividum]